MTGVDAILTISAAKQMRWPQNWIIPALQPPQTLSAPKPERIQQSICNLMTFVDQTASRAPLTALDGKKSLCSSIFESHSEIMGDPGEPAAAPVEEGPLSSRIESKSWKTRVEAYDELSKVCFPTRERREGE